MKHRVEIRRILGVSGPGYKNSNEMLCAATRRMPNDEASTLISGVAYPSAWTGYTLVDPRTGREASDSLASVIRAIEDMSRAVEASGQTDAVVQNITSILRAIPTPIGEWADLEMQRFRDAWWYRHADQIHGTWIRLA